MVDKRQAELSKSSFPMDSPGACQTLQVRALRAEASSDPQHLEQLFPACKEKSRIQFCTMQLLAPQPPGPGYGVLYYLRLR